MIEDADAMVEAVMDVLAPKVAAPGQFGEQRWPVIRFDYEGHSVMPSDGQVRALAEQIVTAIRTATPAGWRPSGDGEERTLPGGLTAAVSPSAASPGQWIWAITARTPRSAEVRAVGLAGTAAAAKGEADAWETAHA